MQAGSGNYAEAYDQQRGPAEIAGEGLPFLAWTREASHGLPEFEFFLTAAQQFALQLAGGRFSPGGHLAAVDIGFGAGWFLGALRALGLQPYGLEVADSPVDLLREKGFAVAKSTDGKFPSQWPVPALITVFEVLEHLEQPLEFLVQMCRQHPGADLMLSVPDEHRWFLLGGREAHDYPPNHLTRWSAAALNLALRKAGYQHVRVWRVPPTPQELAMAKLRRFLPAFGNHAVTSATGKESPVTSLAGELRKRRQRRFLLGPVVAGLRLMGKTACSMLAHASNRTPV
jgi:Methyltransferase domain